MTSDTTSFHADDGTLVSKCDVTPYIASHLHHSLEKRASFFTTVVKKEHFQTVYQECKLNESSNVTTLFSNVTTLSHVLDIILFLLVSDCNPTRQAFAMRSTAWDKDNHPKLFIQSRENTIGSTEPVINNQPHNTVDVRQLCGGPLSCR